jgi:hypothetical protein
MTRTAAVGRLGSEFDDFLFAPVAEEKNGMLLSVVSALARLDLDPWQEAANLAGLPTETATRRLASMIAALPDEPAARREPGKIAARLVALLPRGAGAAPLQPAALTGVGKKVDRRFLVFIAFMAVTLIVQVFLESSNAPPRVDNATAPISDAASARGTPPISDR